MIRTLSLSPLDSLFGYLHLIRRYVHSQRVPCSVVRRGIPVPNSLLFDYPDQVRLSLD